MPSPFSRPDQPVPSLPSAWSTLQLVMFSGKGGVGKTTSACSFARAWAHQFPDERIRLLSTDPAHSLGDVLQSQVTDRPEPSPDRPNLEVQALNAHVLLQEFREEYGHALELLVERGSFVEGEDLTPVWDLNWPGVDELMGLLEIQRLLNEKKVDRVVVDMAPSGHTLNLFRLMDFLDTILSSLELFQEKHRTIHRTLTGQYREDRADDFLQTMKQQMAEGRALLQDGQRTACFLVAIPEPMSWLETHRFLQDLQQLDIPFGGLWINRTVSQSLSNGSPLPTDFPDISALDFSVLDRLSEQQQLLEKFKAIACDRPVLTLPLCAQEPIGAVGLDALFAQVRPVKTIAPIHPPVIQWPRAISPGFPDFIQEGRKLILVGGKGGVGKTTVTAAIGWGMAQRHPDRHIRMVSIDPAHSLGDAFGQALGHEAKLLQIEPLQGNHFNLNQIPGSDRFIPTRPLDNLSAQEVDAEIVLENFRDEYLWELAEMMSGEEANSASAIKLAYGPEAWRQIVTQALPGIDEMLSLITVIELLERHEQDLIILDTAPTGHLLRFLEMPTALGEWLAWIFKLWIKYQNVLGRTELMGRLRQLRQKVMLAQKKLKDPQHTEFIGVAQAQSAIVAEAERLTQSITTMGIQQRYLVHNRAESGQTISPGQFPQQTLVTIPALPRSVPALMRVIAATSLLF